MNSNSLINKKEKPSTVAHKIEVTRMIQGIALMILMTSPSFLIVRDELAKEYKQNVCTFTEIGGMDKKFLDRNRVGKDN